MVTTVITDSRPGWRGPEPDQILAWTLVQVGHAVGRTFWRTLGDVGLTPIQFGVLLQLDREPGQSNAALARAVLVTPQSMSELLTGLVADGLVARDPATRGRPVATHLTAAGRAALRRCEAPVAAVEASLALTDDQRATLAALLSLIPTG